MKTKIIRAIARLLGIRVAILDHAPHEYDVPYVDGKPFTYVRTGETGGTTGGAASTSC